VLYLQQFLRGPRYDLRLLLLDGQLLGAMQRIPRDGDFRANLSQQGTAVPWQPSPEELLPARRAAEITGAIFAGVDLMHRDDLQPVVIEVNAVPGLEGPGTNLRSSRSAALLVAWIEKRIGQARRRLKSFGTPVLRPSRGGCQAVLSLAPSTVSGMRVIPVPGPRGECGNQTPAIPGYAAGSC
jgi:hypothetical protein